MEGHIETLKQQAAAQQTAGTDQLLSQLRELQREHIKLQQRYAKAVANLATGAVALCETAGCLTSCSAKGGREARCSATIGG